MRTTEILTMPTPTKFTEGRRTRIIQILSAGGSRREAARAVGVDHATLTRWLRRGERSLAPEGRFAEFHRAVLRAERDPHLVALEDQQTGWEVNVTSAWRYLERVGEFDPAPPEAESPTGPTVIQLTLGRTPPEGLELRDEEDPDE